jgi:tetratricopeptide (TPR) repeat protein
MNASSFPMKLLSSSLRLARIHGVDIRFHVSILFSIPIAYMLFRPGNFRETAGASLWLLGLILSVFLHELGHAFAAQLVGVEVKSIVIWLLGGFTNFSHPAGKPTHNLAIFSAGPLVNMVLGFFLVVAYILLFYWFLPFESNVELFLWGQTIANISFSLALANIILALFNLLPIYPLDGGNMLHSVIEMVFGSSNADWITLLVSAPLLIGLATFAIITRDYLLLASCILIGLAVGALNRSFLRRLNFGINYLFKRSGFHYLQGDFERAAQGYTKDIEREPLQPAHYLARAVCYLNALQIEKAIPDVERVLKLTPRHALALQLRGEIYAMDKNFDAALDLFARAQAINPHWAVPYFDRGSVLLDKRDFQSALVELDKAISLLPQTWLFYLERSIVYFKLGNLELAHKDQSSALRLSEKDALVMAELNLIIYKDCLDWAEDYYARVLLKQPRSGYAYHGRADAYRVNEQHKNAIVDYTCAMEFMPKESSLYLGRGKSYLALNESEKAKADLEKISALTGKLHLKRQAGELLKTL